MCSKLTYLVSFILMSVLATTALADLLGDPELTFYYSFDEVTDVVLDQSGNGHDGVVTGDVTADPEGVRGGAAKFATGSYLDLDGPSIPPEHIPTTGITLAAWAKCEDTGDHHAIFNARAADATWLIHPELRSEGNFRWLLRAAGGSTIFDMRAGEVTWDEWLHFCGMYDQASGRAALYIDGELIQEQTISGASEIAGDWGSGARVGYNIDNARPFTGLMDMLWLFRRSLSEGEIIKAMQGEAYPFALSPDPADGAIIEETWATVSWSPGDFAVSHDVYFSDNFDDVNDTTDDAFRGNQILTYLVVGFPGFPYPDGLVPGTTYYWRIVEINEADPNSPWAGPVWSFSVAPRTAYNPDPADGAESVDPAVTLSWTAGFGAKLHTVFLGDDYDEVSSATGGAPQGATSYTPDPLEVEKVYYWRVDEFDGAATYKGDIWSFTTPGAVGSPSPADGAVDVKMTATLSWTASASAASHEMYFGTDEDAVRSADAAAPEYKGSQTLGAESYDPGRLAWHTVYYWRVDEVDGQGNTVKGPLWTFTTAGFITVDDFEDYTDDDAAGQAIWQSWIDGFGVPENGAQAGNLMPPYAEQKIVHTGLQSMPLFYDNAPGAATYSEATLTLSYPRDWTENGVGALVIWFRGMGNNAAEPLYASVANSGGPAATVVHGDANAAQAGSWTKWVIQLQTLADQGIDLMDVDTITIGLGTKGAMTTPGGTGTMYIDDIRLYRPPPVEVEIENSSFELPGTEKQTGFDNVPGWNTDGPCADSGVETGFTPTDGDWTAYLMSGDPSVWQLTDHTITAWDVRILTVDARITWAATTMQMTVYYDDNGTRVPAVSAEVALTDAMQEYTLRFAASDVPESVGHLMGIEFSNVSSGDTWIGLDNVRLAPASE